MTFRSRRITLMHRMHLKRSRLRHRVRYRARRRPRLRPPLRNRIRRAHTDTTTTRLRTGRCGARRREALALALGAAERLGAGRGGRVAGDVDTKADGAADDDEQEKADDPYEAGHGRRAVLRFLEP